MAVVQSEGALVAVHKPMTGTITRGLETYDGEMATFAELYRRQPNVRMVNGFLARNIAQLGLHAYEAVSDEERRRLDRAHPLARLIRRPNPYMTRYAFVDALVHDLGIYDLWISLKARNRETGELRLFRIPPYMVEPAGDSWLYPDGYVVKGSKSKLELDASQVFVIHGYNPGDPRGGLSPLESLRRVLAEETAAGEWREQFWRNAARISGILTRPTDAPRWSDKARDRFRAEWQSTWAGSAALAGATPILEEGMTWTAASFSAKDSEYLGARLLARAEVAAAYFVSPLFVGILENANFSNVAEQHKHLYQDTLGPRLVQIEEEFELQVLPEFDDIDQDATYLEFNLAEKLKGSFEEEAVAMQSAVGAPWMTRNEARARKNMPPVEGGDQLVTPLNVLVGGQASPRDSAPPASGAAARRAAKSAADLNQQLTGWHAKHVEQVGAYLDRQKTAVVDGLAGGSLDDAWDDSAWNDELHGVLYPLAYTMADEIGADVADQWGATFDISRADAYLYENSRIAAESVNATTKAAVAAALADAGEDDDLAELAGDVFDADGRVDQIATTRTTGVASFASHEGAAQAGVTQKVWRVTSSRPRAGHPSDGETVGIDDTFSNGARWPGDASAGADQSAGCTCELEFTTEEP